MQATRIVRDRLLTPEEAAAYRAQLEAIEKDKPEIERRLREEGPGPWGWEDFREFINCVRALKEERQRQGLSLEEVAAAANLRVNELQELETEHEFNPRLPVITRYAHALGFRLAMTLALPAPRKQVLSSQFADPVPASLPISAAS